MRNIFKYGLLAMAIVVTSVGVRAQDIPVSGVVKDKSNNSTLPYASVIVKNESGKTVPQLSTTTDDNGRFSTKVKSGYRLVFSFNTWIFAISSSGIIANGLTVAPDSKPAAS